MTLIKGKQIPQKEVFVHLSTRHKWVENESIYLPKSRQADEAYRITTPAQQANPHENDAIAIITVRDYKSQGIFGTKQRYNGQIYRSQHRRLARES